MLRAIQRRLRIWTLPAISSSAIHTGIAVAALWYAIDWTPRPITVEPLLLVESEPARESPKTPPPAPPPKPKTATKSIPPPAREAPARSEPELAAAAPLPAPAKIPDPPVTAVETPRPEPVRATEPPTPPSAVVAPSPKLARSPEVEEKTPAQPRSAEARPVEVKHEEAAAAQGAESGVAAIAAVPSSTAGSPTPSRTRRDAGRDLVGPAREPGAREPGAAAARSGEVSRFARPAGGYQVIPQYPPAARHERVEGTTLLKVLVLADGRVGNVTVQKSAGHPDLDRAAAEAVRQWHFDPARRGSEAVATEVLLPVEFQLKD